MNTWRNVILLGALSLGAYQDWRERQIQLAPQVLAGVSGFVLWVVDRTYTAAELAGGIGIGVLLLLLAALSRGQVGAGDGVMIIVSGVFLGFWRNFELLLSAMLLAAIAALYLLVVRKKGRGYQMPFLPCLLIAYMLQLI